MNTRRVADFVDALLHNRRPKPFEPGADDAEAMRAAIDLRSAQPGAALPDPDFVADLHRRLATEFDADRDTDEVVRAPSPLTRRRLLAGIGVAAAAAAAAGVALDREVLSPGNSPTTTQARLKPDQGTWEAVMTADELPHGGVARFTTSSAVGFVVNDAGNLRAVSGVCTHQGCLLRHNAGGDRLDCPCHRASFDLAGKVIHHEFAEPLSPLPRLDVRSHDGNIEVFAPPPV